MRLKKTFFYLFVFFFCFSLKAQEGDPSVFDDLLDWEKEPEEISCLDLPQAFETYKNDVWQSHNLSSILSDLKNFLRTVKSTRQLLLGELNEKINALDTAENAVAATKNQLISDQEPINHSLGQCLLTQNECQNLSQTFKDYNGVVWLSQQSLNVLLRDLAFFLSSIKENEKISPREIEKKITDLEEAEAIISENNNLLTHRANNISSNLNECLL